VVAFDSVHRKLFLTPQTGGGGSGITQLTGDGTAGPGSGSQVLTFATVNSTTGTFGGAATVGQFTVNGKGLITAAAGVSIQIAESQVTNLTADLASKLGTTLTAGHILVGNLSNVATSVAVSQDVGLINTGAATVVGLQGVALPSLTTGYLNYTGSAWALSALSLTYAQHATNNTISIAGGNTATLLPATNLVAGLLDTARVNFIDSGRNRLFVFHFVQGLQPAGYDSAQLGGVFYKADTIATNGFDFNITGLPNKSSLLATDSILIETSPGQIYKVPPSAVGGILSRVTITSGTSFTASFANTIFEFNFSSTQGSFTFTMPPSPTDQQLVLFETGPTLGSGTEITTLTVSPNTGQAGIIANVPLTTLAYGGIAAFRYRSSDTYWVRVQ